MVDGKTKGKKGGRLDREQVLAARPEALPVVRREEGPNGGANVTVRLAPRRWMGWLHGSRMVERTFNLDGFGREVYEACDGKTDVRTVIRRFAERHRLSVAEAELSVTTFLKTLMSKGLVAMAVKMKEE